MHYHRLYWLACIPLAFSACSNSTNTALHSGNIEEILVVDKSRIQFSTQRNAPPPGTQLISARHFGDELRITPVDPLPAWLKMEVNEHPKRKLSVMQFSITDTKMDAGQYQAKIILSVIRHKPFGYDHLGRKELSVQYRIMDRFDISKNQIKFFSVYGEQEPLRTHIEIFGSGSLWQAKANQPWIKLSRTTGRGNATLEVSVDRHHPSLQKGEHIASVELSDQFSGRKLEIPVAVYMEAARMRVDRDGLAFTQLYPNGVVEAQIRVKSNFAETIEWSAHSNKRWIKVKKSQEDENILLVKVNPKRMEKGMHYGKIFVKARGKARNREVVRVGFYINGAIKNPRKVVQLALPHHRSEFAVDPIRPFVYMTAEKQLFRHHVYTGEKEMMADLERELGSLTVSSDGRFLYAADSEKFAILVYDLEKSELSQIWDGPFFQPESPQPLLRMVYLKPNGHPILVTNGLQAVDARSGDFLTRFQPSIALGESCCEKTLPFIAASPDHGSLYIQERGELSHELYRFSVDYSYIKSVGLRITQTGYMVEDGIALDLAVSPDGGEVCTVSTGQKMTRCYFGEAVSPSRTLVLPAQPNNIEFSHAGNIYAAVTTLNRRASIWRFNALSGKKGRRYRLKNEINDRQMRLSADELSIISFTQSSESTIAKSN